MQQTTYPDFSSATIRLGISCELSPMPNFLWEKKNRISYALLCKGFRSQSTQEGHVESGQFT